MPYIFSVATKAQAENYATSATPNTEIDYLFIRPGATRRVGLLGLRTQGKGAGLTALSGIINRVKVWTTTAASAGTSATPAPSDNTGPAAAHTAGLGTGGGVAAVTSGTGGPTLVNAVGCGASGPGGWVAPNPDAVVALDGGANKSIDVFSASGTASMNFETVCDTQE